MLTKLIRHIRFKYRQAYLNWIIQRMQRLLNGPQAWYVLDCLGITGFGTKLIRFDYPPDTELKPSWGSEKDPHLSLKKRIELNQDEQNQWFKGCLEHMDAWQKWPEQENLQDSTLPWKCNEFLLGLDQLTLYGMLRQIRPPLYLEIGSGLSTRIAWQARKDGKFPMKMISIDPGSKVGVTHLCDQLYSARLEDMTTEVLRLMHSGAVLFFDGSHFCFPSSDVTCFFLNILPELPAGAIIHVHDIFLPFDYPKKARTRYWSEQYILAAWLLGGADDFDIILPCAHLASQTTNQTMLKSLSSPVSMEGSSFWLRKKEVLITK
jgi:hypothetical protein